MKDRCLNPNNLAFGRYGGRGIKICKRWLNSLFDFEKDMGPKPSPKHSLDRIDNDGNYTPKNCRWATHTQQCANKSPKSKMSKKAKAALAKLPRHIGPALTIHVVPQVYKF